MTLGKLGSIYFGDTPSATKELRVGVRPLSRKSARKPSRDIRIVVGAKLEVPFDTVAVVPFLRFRESSDILNAPRIKRDKVIAIVTEMRVI